MLGKVEQKISDAGVKKKKKKKAKPRQEMTVLTT